MDTTRRSHRLPTWVCSLLLAAALIAALVGATGAFTRLVPPANATAGGWSVAPDAARILTDTPAPIHIAYDGLGNLHRVLAGQPAVYEWYDGNAWQRVDAPGAGPIAVSADGIVHLVYAADGDIVHTRFASGAWTAPAVIARTTGDSLNPAIALDGKGRPQVVWEDFSLGRPEVLFSSYANGVWSRTVNLSASPERGSIHPQVAAGRDDRIHVVWQEEDLGGAGAYDISYAVWDGVWSAPEQAISWSGDQEEPALVIDHFERPVVAFADYAHGGIYLTQREGSSWLAPRQIDIDRSGGQAPALAVAVDNTFSLTWIRQARTGWWPAGRPEPQVFFRTITADKLGVPVSLSQGLRITHNTLPQLALTADGKPSVAYAALTAGGLSPVFAQRPTVATPFNPVLVPWAVCAVVGLLALVGLLISLRDRRSDGRPARAPWYRTPFALAAMITVVAGIIVNLSVGLGRRLIAMPVNTRPAGWTAPTPVSRGPGDASAPRLAVDAQGRVNLVWAGTVGTTKRIYYRDLAGDEIRTIDSVTTGGSGAPSLTTVDGRLYVAWESWNPAPETMLAEGLAAGWSAPQAVFPSGELTAETQLQTVGNRLTAGAEHPLLVGGRAPGLLDLIWTFGTRNRGDIIAAARQNGQWGAPTNVSQNGGVSDLASASVQGGKLHVAWSDSTSDEAVGQNRGDILYRVFDGQTWSPVRNISSNPTHSTDPTVIAEKSGRVSFVWVESSSGTRLRGLLDAYSRNRPAGSPATVMYRRIEGGRLSQPRSIDVPLPHDFPQTPGAVAVAAAADADGRLHVVWSRFTGSEYRLYYRRLNGLRWSRTYLLAQSDTVSEPFTFQAVEPDIAVGPDGTVHVVWPEYRNGRFDISYLRRPPVDELK